MATRKQLLEKTADILERLAEKCGGPGGKPGPCPLGKTKPSAGGSDNSKQVADKQAATKKASSEAAAATEALSSRMKKNDWKVLSHWAKSGKYHAEDAIAKLSQGKKEDAIKAHSRGAEIHMDTARYHSDIARGAKKKSDVDAHLAAAAAHKQASNLHRESLKLLSE